MLKGIVNCFLKKRERKKKSEATTKTDFGNISVKIKLCAKSGFSDRQWLPLVSSVQPYIAICAVAKEQSTRCGGNPNIPWNCTTLLQSSPKCCCWTRPCSTHTHQPHPWVRSVKGSAEFLAGEKGRMLPLPGGGGGGERKRDPTSSP